MHHSLRYRKSNEDPWRQIAITLQCVILLAGCFCGANQGHQVSAQSKPAEAAKSPLCTRDNALEMIKQQVDLTKTFNNTLRRITVLIRAGDLLWPYQQNKAHAVFAEAFELAIDNEKENEQKGPRSVILRMQIPDQRYVVIRAVAKHDSAWAKELTSQMLKLDTQDGAASQRRDSFSDLLTAERLFDSARELVSTDLNAALDLAGAGLNYPAADMLIRFLYQLAAVDQQASRSVLRASACGLPRQTDERVSLPASISICLA